MALSRKKRIFTPRTHLRRRTKLRQMPSRNPPLSPRAPLRDHHFLLFFPFRWPVLISPGGLRVTSPSLPRRAMCCSSDSRETEATLWLCFFWRLSAARLPSLPRQPEPGHAQARARHVRRARFPSRCPALSVLTAGPRGARLEVFSPSSGRRREDSSLPQKRCPPPSPRT